MFYKPAPATFVQPATACVTHQVLIKTYLHEQWAKGTQGWGGEGSGGQAVRVQIQTWLKIGGQFCFIRFTFKTSKIVLNKRRNMTENLLKVLKNHQTKDNLTQMHSKLQAWINDWDDDRGFFFLSGLNPKLMIQDQMYIYYTDLRTLQQKVLKHNKCLNTSKCQNK